MSLVYLLLKIGAVWLCSILWRKGGDGQSYWRNPGVGIVMGITVAICNHSWLPLLFIPGFWAVIQAFSYGVNAPIHIIWLRLFGYEIRMANHGKDEGVEFYTRVTVAILWSIPTLLFGLPLWVWVTSAIARAIVIGLIAVYADDVVFSECGVGLMYSSVVLL